MEMFFIALALLCAAWAVLAELAKHRLRNTVVQTQFTHRAAEEQLRSSETRVKAILDAVPDTIIRLNRAGNLLEILSNPNSKTLLTADFVGRPVEEIVGPAVAARYLNALEQATKTGRLQIFTYESEKGGLTRGREVRITVCGEDLLAIERDTTERTAMEKELRYLSLYDSLTGLFNRTWFEQEMRRLSHRDYAPVGMVICDMDGLKLVNDTLGHEQGDKMLVAAADILRSCFRTEDVIARIGGDEFAVLMPNADTDMLTDICLQLSQAVAEYNALLPNVQMGLSVGHAISGDSVDMNVLFQDADNVMYRQKLLHGEKMSQFIIDGMYQAVEVRDHFGLQHPDRLADYSCMLSDQLGLDEDRLNKLRLLARYHDIGKVGIAEHIIMKPSRLTKEEMREMVRHSEIGSRIARSVPNLTPIADLILKHHENWDGSGYPLGLKQKAIPLECRILSIADAYEVMTAGRPHSPARSSSEALDELRREAGRQFDPALVNLFIQALAEKEALNEEV